MCEPTERAKRRYNYTHREEEKERVKSVVGCFIPTFNWRFNRNLYFGLNLLISFTTTV